MTKHQGSNGFVIRTRVDAMLAHIGRMLDGADMADETDCNKLILAIHDKQATQVEKLRIITFILEKLESKEKYYVEGW